jgi:hypothetical protein
LYKLGGWEGDVRSIYCHVCAERAGKWIAWSVVYAKLRLVRRVVNMVGKGGDEGIRPLA